MKQCSRHPQGRARHPISDQLSRPTGRGTISQQDSRSRALECSPTGGYQAPSLLEVDPVALIRAVRELMSALYGEGWSGARRRVRTRLCEPVGLEVPVGRRVIASVTAQSTRGSELAGSYSLSRIRRRCWGIVL
jgi:hypothetical protein